MTPKLIKYSSGYFKLAKENLPESVQENQELQGKVLVMLYKKYANYNWGSTLPEQRFEEINDYVYSLIKEYF